MRQPFKCEQKFFVIKVLKNETKLKQGITWANQMQIQTKYYPVNEECCDLFGLLPFPIFAVYAFSNEPNK